VYSTASTNRQPSAASSFVSSIGPSASFSVSPRGSERRVVPSLRFASALIATVDADTEELVGAERR
jgi:hypothetical protein